jgi:hypothetical protein
MDVFDDEVLIEKKPTWEIAFVVMNQLLWEWGPVGELLGEVVTGIKCLLLLTLAIAIRTALIVLLPLSVAFLTHLQVRAYKKEVARAERARNLNIKESLK